MTTTEFLSTATENYLFHVFITEKGMNPYRENQVILDDFVSYFCDRLKQVAAITTEDIALYFNYVQINQPAVDSTVLEQEPPALIKPGNEQVQKGLSTFFEWIVNTYKLSTPVVPENLAKYSQRIPPLNLDDIRRIYEVIAKSINIKIKDRYVSPSDVRAHRNITLIFFLLDTGIRTEELAKLKVKDINLNECNVELHDFYNRSKKRVIPFGNLMKQTLSRYFALQYPKSDPEEELLFRKDSPWSALSRKSLHEHLSKLGHKAGIDNLFALRFRATFVKFYQEQGYLEDTLLLRMGLTTKQQLRLCLDEVTQDSQIPPQVKLSLVDEWFPTL